MNRRTYKEPSPEMEMDDDELDMGLSLEQTYHDKNLQPFNIESVDYYGDKQLVCYLDNNNRTNYMEIDRFKEEFQPYTLEINRETGLALSRISPEPMKFNDALEYAKNCREGGYDDWRLPTVKEVKKLQASGITTDNNWCWTSTQCRDWKDDRYVWEDANIGYVVSSLDLYVRLVRDIYNGDSNE
jgi:Protein of unknown function (DUF1566)